MKNIKIIAFIICFIALHIGVNAQILTPNENKKGKWGYVNEKGKAVIKYKYDEAREFSEDLAAVKLKGLSGFIDKSGKVIIPFMYDEINDFSEGLAKVKKNYKFGFVDKTGKEIIPVIYDEIESFSEEGLAKVKKDRKFGFVDKTGKEIILVIYDEIGNFLDGLAKVKSGGHWGFINKTGEMILPIEYDEIGEFNDGLAKIKKNKKFGFTNKTGKIVIPLKYDNAIGFSNGYAAYAYSESFFTYGGFVDTRTNWGIINKTGQEILLAEYTEKEIKEMLSDPTQLQKKIAKEAEKEMLTEDILAVLDNDYYSDESHSIEVLSELIDKLKKLIDDSTGKEKEELEKLYKDLWLAVRTKMITEKYGIATAKKIMVGKYEIGMDKDACFDAIASYVPLLLDAYYGGKRFVFDAKLSSQTKTAELWEVVAPGNKKMLWTFSNGKLARITNY
ncbi:WG repeat-containing protein [Bacteroidales bacterium OttesenSCG-928-M06]|nr:WG repeat-containing protein [Bacteroidales bacterium OttesenSCG-928-M06]